MSIILERTPKVSIILPVYNVEKYISKSIQSILDQTLDNFELLIIDDGSPDSSIQIARQYNDTRIKIFHKENGGLSDTRNYGLERAKGKYVYFMDSDDWIESNLLENCINTLEKQELDIVIFGYFQDNENQDGQVVSFQEITPNAKVVYKKDQSLVLDSKMLGLLGYAWNKVYRRAFLDKHNFRFEKGISLVEDILFNAEVYQKVDVLYFLPSSYYHYANRPIPTLIKKFHPNSFELKVMKSKAIESFIDSWRINKKYEILSNSIMDGITYCLHNLFYFDAKLSKDQKNQYLKEMFAHARTREMIDHYKPKAIKKILLKYAVKYHLYNVINISLTLMKQINVKVYLYKIQNKIS